MTGEIHLWGKKVLLDKSPVVFKYQPGEDWLEHWEPKTGEWKCEDGYLIGAERKSTAALLISKREYGDAMMLSFTVQAIPPRNARPQRVLFCKVERRDEFPW